MSFVYLPEVVADPLRVFTSTNGEQSAMSNGISIVKKSCKLGSRTAYLTMRQSGITLKHSTGNPGVDAWILSLLAFRVNRSQLRESKRESMTKETDGRTLFALLEKSDQNTACWKTSQVSLLTNTLELYLKTWPKAGIMQNGKCYLLPKLAQRISGIDSGLWRTPHASDPEGGIMEMREGKSEHYKLRDHVQYINRKYWLTPSTVEIAGGEDRILKRTAYRETVGRKYAPGSLAEQVRWPTPTTQEIEHNDIVLTESGRREAKGNGGTHSINLADKVMVVPS